MAYYARKIDYAAATSTYVALMEISKKRNGKPIKFVVYRYNHRTDNKFESIEFKPEEKEVAVKSFPYGKHGFGGYINNSKDFWEKTTDYLHKAVFANFWNKDKKYDWVKVGRPALWNKRRKKKRLKFGELSHILLKYQGIMKNTEKDLADFKKCLLYEYGYGYPDDINEKEKEEIKRLTEIITEEKIKIMAIKSEMRFVREKNYQLWIKSTIL
ncbi:hypothetical protein HZB06_01460 [Candidatus Wolfebacteria bacterium]|nr:hypothetical protein [Candidatus Wolfebacteria bacterium]